MARDTYSAEPCSTCGAAIVGALLDDHGFVIEAACATHRHYLARSFVARRFRDRGRGRGGARCRVNLAITRRSIGREWREVVRRDCRRPRRPGNAIETTRGSTAIVWRERWRPGNGNRRVLDLATIKRRPGFRSPANYPAWAALVDDDGALTEAGRAIEGALG